MTSNLSAVYQKRILLVEDEAPLRRIFSQRLQKRGFQVLEASGGLEGLEIALKKIPDLILLDIIMPGMNGLTMLRKLRKVHQGKNIPVIILSNVENLEMAISLFDHGYSYAQNISPAESTSEHIKKYLDIHLDGGIVDYFVKIDTDFQKLTSRIREVLFTPS